MLGLATGFAIHQLFEGYTLYGFGAGSIVGVLALGYVVAGLTTGETRTTSTQTNSSAPEPALLSDMYSPERDDYHRTDGDRR